MMTQIELEAELCETGKARMENMIARNEANGGAANNPYASAIYRRFVQPIADEIRTEIETPKPGRNAKHVALLKGSDPSGVAYILVKTLINDSLRPVSAHNLLAEVGRRVFAEMALSAFEIENPKLYFTLTRDLERRDSIELPSWGPGCRMQVGAYLMDRAIAHGLIEMRKVNKLKNGKPYTGIEYALAEPIMELIGHINDAVTESAVTLLPCVEKPRDWTSIESGGWHTAQMIASAPACVAHNPKYRRLLDKGDLTTTFNAINALQSTEWKINGRLLEMVKDIAQYRDTDEIVRYEPTPKPLRPSWLHEDLKKEAMTLEQQRLFIEWKRNTAIWFTQQKVRASKLVRFSTAIRIADKFKYYDKLYFVYFSDFRGRLYAQTMGVSPQGSDLQKALLQFAEGKPLNSREAISWFMINGANKYGYDKASLDDRVKWCATHHAEIMASAESPLDGRFWEAADSPLQFLAWCFEYRRYQENPQGFLSYLPVGMDGSCNGLQNFSAMLRDEVGGAATNLVPSALPNDIYAQVARQVTRLLGEWKCPDDTEDEVKREQMERFHRMWTSHGISRNLVKRSVMTRPYGSTRSSCTEFIAQDYLKQGKAPEFVITEYLPAARFLSFFVWEAIALVVIKANEAMQWLQTGAKEIMKNGDHVIQWRSPDGFPVVQEYEAVDVIRVRTRLLGGMVLRSAVAPDFYYPDKARHKNGIAPNMVHCIDAAHMKFVAVRGHTSGLSLAMIHDDFGCHAADAQTLYTIIREEFVRMHTTCNPLEMLRESYDLAPIPEYGSLDLSVILDSTYFFS